MRVLVSGVSGALGLAICVQLEKEGCEVTPAARRPKDGEVRLDLTDEEAVRREGRELDAAILCPILTTSAPAVRWLVEEGAGRVVCFSSNNVAVDQESAVYRALAEAEKEALGAGGAVTVLRPTMIYGHPGDGNLARLLGAARRFGGLPMPGRGGAMQQPVFFEDVARAAVLAATGPFRPGAHCAAGPETLTARALHEKVLAAAGRSPRALLPLPLAPLRMAAGSAEAVGLKLALGTAQLARMEADKTARLAQLPGFTPEIGVEEGLERLAAALAGRPARG